MEQLGNVSLVVLFLSIVVFCVVYSLLSRWWENPAGRNVFTFMATIGVLLGLGLLRLAIGPVWFDHHRGWLRVVSYNALTVIVVWRIILMIRIQLSAQTEQLAKQVGVEPNSLPPTKPGPKTAPRPVGE